ncbi:MAG: hypothetical protein P8L45_05320 [Longimicrobiales bacterium]|nr:hypothetical protein [Longimicrobiales bacterium]
MDDPIFDPWSIGKQTPAKRATDMPAPRRWVAPAAPVSGPTSGRTIPVGEEGVPDDVTVPAKASRSSHRIRPMHPLQQLSPLVALRGVVRPRLEELKNALEFAGHEVVLDDRSDEKVPSLRFRFVPRRGVFDQPRGDEGAVLEITWDEDAAHVAARLWLDPIAAEWTEEVTAAPAQVDAVWVDRVILEFVSTTLEAHA